MVLDHEVTCGEEGKRPRAESWRTLLLKRRWRRRKLGRRLRRDGGEGGGGLGIGVPAAGGEL